MHDKLPVDIAGQLNDHADERRKLDHVPRYDASGRSRVVERLLDSNNHAGRPAIWVSAGTGRDSYRVAAELIADRLWYRIHGVRCAQCKAGRAG
ncbi:hypothetical protein D3C78_866290 [compost metagenome]